MRILVNISVISKNHRGMGTFTKQIIKKLLQNDSQNYIFVSGNDLDYETYNMIKESRHIYKQINIPLPIFEQLIIPYLIWKYKPQVCWFPSNTFPLIKTKKVKYVVTIHDLIFLKGMFKPKKIYQKIGKLYRKFNILFGIRNIDIITSVSKTVLTDVYIQFKIRKEVDEKYVIYNSLQMSSIEDKNIFSKLNFNMSEKYIYTISGSAPHKNLNLLIDSFKYFHLLYPDYKLIISGVDKDFTCDNKNIIFTSYVSEEEKVALMKNADLFVFASLDEGFGIPLIEGLYHNSHVLVSDIPVFREIGKGYVNYFDPKDRDFLIKYFTTSQKKISHDEAKKYILDTFNAEKNAKKLVDIFNKFKFGCNRQDL